ncbi:MAG: TSUP family transporter, partial [Actinomycetota bacterium]|nr:TSUP family transporter [Actinomycetota bacterium]
MGLPAASGTVQGLAMGLAAGVMSGLFGIGGGAVLVPLLVMAGLEQHRAHATSLAAIILTAVSGTLAFAGEDAVLVVPG